MTDREALILDHLDVVRDLANRSCGAVEYDDLVSHGCIGLLQAADSFDPCHGASFRTYAYVRVRGAILDGLRSADRLSRRHRDHFRSVECVYHDSPEQLPLHEVQTKLGVSDSQFGWMTTAIEVEHSDYFTDDSPSAADILHRKQVVNNLYEAITALPEKSRTVICLYYLDGLMMKEIGAILDITESRVSQIHTKAIKQLRKMLFVCCFIV